MSVLFEMQFHGFKGLPLRCVMTCKSVETSPYLLGLCVDDAIRYNNEITELAGCLDLES
jgi:hypothetical protein